MIEDKAMGRKRHVSFGVNNIKRDYSDPPKTAIDQFSAELIECGRQPGKLKITKRACGRRYLMANAGEYKKYRGGFKMGLQWSLEICKICPEGCKNAEALSPTPSPRGHRFS
jgi:hypothetical protein